ncbi:hypothetical protein K474DRAFT_904153 [Panus rudis PR-1116 ss-1]|nr:hypothetical protein K474DRAFT_904153 [Panus rudis PR-1116 ss-1]
MYIFRDLIEKVSALSDLLYGQLDNNRSQTTIRQTLIATINEYKESLSQARRLASDLPGGDITVEEQEDVIKLLEGLISERRSALNTRLQSLACPQERKADSPGFNIDSTASTPASN